VILAILSTGVVFAAEPPPFVNYQGVLRDSADRPLDGTYDMVLRFYGPADEEIFIDRHTSTLGGPVTVAGGMFSVWLGGGAPLDGSGPGTYFNITEVFRDYGEVHLEVQIGADGAPGTEVLSPRIRMVAAAYALNAGTVDGLDSTSILNTSSAAQTKAGPLIVDAGAVPGSIGIEAVGEFYGGDFQTSTGSGWAQLALGNAGIDARGTSMGGYFADSDSSGNAYVGYGDTGISASGYTFGGQFSDSNGTGYAYVGYGDNGINAYGLAAGGFFQDNNNFGRAFVGYGARGIHALGDEVGGYFEDANSSGYAYVGYLDEGISAHGNVQGGFFQDDDSSGLAHVAYGDLGIDARGNLAGAYFVDSNGTGYAYVGYGSTGIEARGTLRGGYFRDSDGSGYASVGYGNVGIYSYGNYAGGYFNDIDSSGYAWVGLGDTGIDGRGAFAGGYFDDSDGDGYAYVGYANKGIEAWGSDGGGLFLDSLSSGSSYVGVDSFKIYGTGGVSFIQNHPYDDSRVIVYSAPEGDEVATYTRGTARLENGEARVALGETFAWVTNPDLGLTAHVTPRSADAVVYVESVSTKELVVRNVTGFPGDAVFDFLVYGLRIGFEERAVLRPKKHESYIPSLADDRAILANEPELRNVTAFERFREMHSTALLTDGESLDLSASQALHAAIHEYDPATDPPVNELLGHQSGRRREVTEPEPADPPMSGDEAPQEPGAASETANIETAAIDTIASDRNLAQTQPAVGRLFPVAEPVEAGDLLALDPERPGKLVRATAAQDPGIVGIAAEAPLEIDGEMRVALVETNYAVVKADAGYGEIRPGDLLTSSFTTGHAMRATEIVPGTVIGKALEPLETGTGLITVLVMPR
jgi:hypothetical protein